MKEPTRIDPDPRIVWLMDYAIDHITPRLQSPSMREVYAPWLKWAQRWRKGERSPAECVAIAEECFANDLHSLGQLAWGAKEACYSTPTSGWLVIRYIADAMVAFGIAFPDEPLPALAPPPSSDVFLRWDDEAGAVVRALPADLRPADPPSGES